VNNNESISFTIPKNSEFIISLPSNNTVAYTWNSNDNIDKSDIIEFVKHTEFNIPYSVKKSTGINYSRQNFYFTPKKDGTETLVMSYEHASEPNDKSFKITLKIKVE
jgi:predicted secreted protein